MVLQCPVCLDPFSGGSNLPWVGSCGHSLCKECCKRLPTKICPMCQKPDVFQTEAVNFMMLDEIDISNQMAAEKDALKKEKEVLEEKHKKQGIELESVKKKAEEALKELNDIKVKEEKRILVDNLFTCSECSSLAKKDHGRLCPWCCHKLGSVALEFKKAKILDLEKTDQAVVCPSCALEGVHKGHETVLYSRLKFKYQVGIDFEKMAASVSVKMADCSKEYSNVNDACNEFLENLKQASSTAQNITNLLEYYALLSHCKKIKEQYESVITALGNDIQVSVQSIKDLGSRLKSSSSGEDIKEKPVTAVSVREPPVSSSDAVPVVAPQNSFKTGGFPLKPSFKTDGFGSALPTRNFGSFTESPRSCGAPRGGGFRGRGGGMRGGRF